MHSSWGRKDTTAFEAGRKVSQLMDGEETADDNETIEIRDVHSNVEEVAEILSSLHEHVDTTPGSASIFTSSDYPSRPLVVLDSCVSCGRDALSRPTKDVGTSCLTLSFGWALADEDMMLHANGFYYNHGRVIYTHHAEPGH